MIARLSVACAASVLMAGCTTAPPAGSPPLPIPVPPPEVVTRAYPRPEQAPVPVPLVEQDGLVRVLDYYTRARQRPARDQRVELDSVRKAFAASRSDYDRVRLALLLSLPNPGFGDDNQVLELLEPLARDASNEYHGLAQLVIVLLNEQRRLEKQATSLQQKLERIRALEKEMQQRTARPEPKKR